MQLITTSGGGDVDDDDLIFYRLIAALIATTTTTVSASLSQTLLSVLSRILFALQAVFIVSVDLLTLSDMVVTLTLLLHLPSFRRTTLLTPNKPHTH